MFLVGITLTIGTNHVLNFFLARKKLRVRCRNSQLVAGQNFLLLLLLLLLLLC